MTDKSLEGRLKSVTPGIAAIGALGVALALALFALPAKTIVPAGPASQPVTESPAAPASTRAEAPGQRVIPLSNSAAPTDGFARVGADQTPVDPDLRGGGAIAGPAQVQQGAAAQPNQVEIVVKFRDDTKIKPIVDSYWGDAEAARNKFAAFSRARDAFSGLRLERVTYSNELVLCPKGDIAPAALRAKVRALQSHPDVEYADPNVTAQPGDR